MEKIARIGYTTFIVFMIVLPLPPSTIIGIALATNPKTGKYMDQRVYRGVMTGMRGVKTAIVVPAAILANQRQISAANRIKAGTFRL